MLKEAKRTNFSKNNKKKKQSSYTMATDENYARNSTLWRYYGSSGALRENMLPFLHRRKRQPDTNIKTRLSLRVNFMPVPRNSD
ncbi:hypothetical protein CEXT_708191 [Caerostris extrusa]|uniref:Uncharacterized protein n=1 Tax=Caerostris extrusa TaxID=172846 RepID=A0AAV4MKZ4_CAEEX|nr:hypothetical protein CEXT_708191 [Caerostris extrusa]